MQWGNWNHFGFFFSKSIMLFYLNIAFVFNVVSWFIAVTVAVSAVYVDCAMNKSAEVVNLWTTLEIVLFRVFLICSFDSEFCQLFI